MLKDKHSRAALDTFVPQIAALKQGGAQKVAYSGSNCSNGIQNNPLMQANNW